MCWNASPVEFTILMKQPADSYKKLFQFSHYLRSVPAVSKEEVLDPFPLYLAQKLKSDLAEILRIEPVDPQVTRQTTLFEFF